MRLVAGAKGKHPLRITRAGTDPLYVYTINRAVGRAIADKMIEGYTKDAQPHVDATNRNPAAHSDKRTESGP